MATDVSVTDDRIQKVFDELEAQKNLISNCTLVWKNLSDHFSSLRQTLADRSQALDSQLQALDAESKQTLESLDLREASIPDRESAATALIQERKDAVLAEIETPDAKPPDDLQGILRWYCRRMDSAGLWRFVVSRRRDLAVLRKEIAEAVAGSVDPAWLVVDAVADFLDHQTSGGGSSTGAGADRCWALGMLLRALFDSEGKKAPRVSASMRERAAAVAEAWKEKLGGNKQQEGEGGMGGSEAQLFLQMVVAFGLSSRFQEEFLRKLVLEHASRKEMGKLAPGLGFGEKLADIIDELVKNGKELEAVYFAHEAGLTERFSPTPLLKSYLQSSRKKANATLKNGNHSAAATEESNTAEMSDLRSIIKCVESCHLESKFSIDGLKKRLAQMEKVKADRKKSAAAKKTQGKRTRSTGGTFPASRPAKATRTFNAPYASYHRSPTVPQLPLARHPYGYPGQGGFDGPATASYGSAHTQSPTVSQQYYMPEEMSGRPSGLPHGSSINYGGGYDYAAPLAAPAQPAYPR
ncbi:FRIGIDA-like protein 4b [Cocos nucifera]|uniref:FRIGIDA-like protein n=1 Tax=Cocos nucifera TaxID=13894 RepID=A0A8K0HXE9_COCNU|nr:FRIGIDA-like protein 4b [Cocos nucifera]